MAGMDEPFVMNLTNTVAAAKQNSASNKNITPLCMLNRQNTKEGIFRQNLSLFYPLYLHPHGIYNSCRQINQTTNLQMR